MVMLAAEKRQQLRERIEDVRLLADHFLREFTTAYGRKPKELTEEAFLPNPVHVRDMILRAQLKPERSLEANRQFLEYQKHFGEAQKLGSFNANTWGAYLLVAVVVPAPAPGRPRRPALRSPKGSQRLRSRMLCRRASIWRRRR